MSAMQARRSLLLAVLGCCALLLAACGRPRADRVSLCGGDRNQLRIGYVDVQEGRDAADQGLLSDREISVLRELLTVASHCQVELEPVASPEQAHLRLRNSSWDAAFLPPGLTAVALERSEASNYSQMRSLGRRQTSQAMLLVRNSSSYRSLSDLRGARLGLLPRGSLTGYYLPLYHLHGLNLGAIHYSLSYDDLLERLRNGDLDVIAWDGDLPDPGTELRPLYQDRNRIPLGALVMSHELVAANHQPFLKTLDENAAQLPPRLGYVATTLPAPQDLHRLRHIVKSVETWETPIEGQPYAVFGRRLTQAQDGVR